MVCVLGKVVYFKVIFFRVFRYIRGGEFYEFFFMGIRSKENSWVYSRLYVLFIGSFWFGGG